MRQGIRLVRADFEGESRRDNGGRRFARIIYLDTGNRKEKDNCVYQCV